jgi:hypothetical protein
VEAVYTPPGGPSLTFRTVPPRSRLGRVVFGRCFSNGGGLKKLCYVKVRITLKDGGVYREDLGYGVMDNARTKAQAWRRRLGFAESQTPSGKETLALSFPPCPSVSAIGSSPRAEPSLESSQPWTWLAQPSRGTTAHGILLRLNCGVERASKGLD